MFGLETRVLSCTQVTRTLARTIVWHSLRNHYFSLYFPEIERFVRSNHAEWLIHLLLRFPTPASITGLMEPEFAAQAGNLVGRKVHKAALLGEVYAVARRSVRVPCRSIVQRSPCFG